MSRIPDKPHYKIGEVCQYTDTQPYVLRFWESEFPQLAPGKSRSGQRMYTRRDIELVLKIKKLLYEKEFTIAGARKQLEMEEAASRGSAIEGLLPNGEAVPSRAAASPAPRRGEAGTGAEGGHGRGGTAELAGTAGEDREDLLHRVRELEERQALLEEEVEAARSAGRRRRERALHVAERLERLLADLDGDGTSPP